MSSIQCVGTSFVAVIFMYLLQNGDVDANPASSAPAAGSPTPPDGYGKIVYSSNETIKNIGDVCKDLKDKYCLEFNLYEANSSCAGGYKDVKLVSVTSNVCLPKKCQVQADMSDPKYKAVIECVSIDKDTTDCKCNIYEKK